MGDRQQHVGGVSMLWRSGLALHRRRTRCAATDHVARRRVRRHRGVEDAGARARIARGEEQVPEAAVERESGRVPEGTAAKIRHLEARFRSLWGDIGEVAEAFGNAWAATADPAAAIAWYTRALDANDGTASLKVVEQLGNLRARNAWATVEKALNEIARPAGKAAGKRGKPRRSAGRGTAKGDRAKAQNAPFDDARKEIAAALALLERVAQLQPTVERESLCGSAWHRVAMIEAAVADEREEAKAIENMKAAYASAVKIARKSKADNLFYPALNWMAAELIANAGKRASHRFDRGLLEEVRANLAAKTRDDPDFWSVAALADLRVYEALAEGNLAGALESIMRDYRDLHARVSAPWMWGSVLDQLCFVLPKYAKRASAPERQAVETLMRLLETFTGAAAD